MLQIKKEIYGNTKLAIMPVLPIVCICEKPDSCNEIIQISKTFLSRYKTFIALELCDTLTIAVPAIFTDSCNTITSCKAAFLTVFDAYFIRSCEKILLYFAELIVKPSEINVIVIPEMSSKAKQE